MSRRIFISLMVVLVLFGARAFPVDENNKPSKTPEAPFVSGETLVYEGELSRSVLRGITIAELKFSAEKVDEKPETAAQFKYKTDVISKGVLLKLFNFSFRQSIDTQIDATSNSLLANSKLDEQGKRRRTSETNVDGEKKILTWTEKDPTIPQNPPRVVTAPVEGAIQDIVSAIYFVRFNKLTPGNTFEFNVTDSGRVVSVPVTVYEKKKIKTVLGKIETIRVEPGLFGETGLIRKRGTISIWFSNDARHIPLKAHITSDFGTVDITLKSYIQGHA